RGDARSAALLPVAPQSLCPPGQVAAPGLAVARLGCASARQALRARCVPRGWRLDRYPRLASARCDFDLGFFTAPGGSSGARLVVCIVALWRLTSSHRPSHSRNVEDAGTEERLWRHLS